MTASIVSPDSIVIIYPELNMSAIWILLVSREGRINVMRLTLGIAGDRNYTDYNFFSKVVRDELERLGGVDHIITGDCQGTDTMALDWAISNGIAHTVYCASRFNWLRLMKDDIDALLCSDWKEDGKFAGPKRNSRLVQDVDSLLLFDGGGPGSASVAKLAKEFQKPLERYQITHWQCAGEHNILVPAGT